jgi:hypothetical protein
VIAVLVMNTVNDSFVLHKAFLELKTALAPYTPIWSREIIYHYPEVLKDYPKEWLEFLHELSDRELHLIDSQQDLSLLKKCPSLDQLVTEMRLKSSLPAKTQDQPDLENKMSIPPWAWNHIKSKKRHEMNRSIPLLLNEINKRDHDSLFDFCGGVGNFSRFMGVMFDTQATVFDFNQQLLDAGKKRVEKMARKRKLPVDFQHLDLLATPSTKNIPAHLERPLYFGLHTCGELGLAIFDLASKKPDITYLNFPCCYHLLNDKKHINLSKEAKTDPLQITSHSLTLAGRSHQESEFSAFEKKKRVKSYRYSLHRFFVHQTDHLPPISVGDSHYQLYSEPFSQYCRKKFEELGLELNYSDHEIDEFYHSEENQEVVRKMFLANIIRWMFGRALEVAILMDRALYFSEKGFQVEMEEVFNPLISPRNIAILAKN